MIPGVTPDFTIGVGDLLPDFTATLRDEYGNIMDLTGATVQLRMRLQNESAGAVVLSATVVDALNGAVKRTWSGSDTATAGAYNANWIVTYTTGTKPETIPSTRHLVIVIQPQV